MVGPAIRPLVHHGQAPAEHDELQVAVDQGPSASLPEGREPQQHDDLRAQREAVRDEPVREFKRRIGDNGPRAARASAGSRCRARCLGSGDRHSRPDQWRSPCGRSRAAPARPRPVHNRAPRCAQRASRSGAGARAGSLPLGPVEIVSHAFTQQRDERSPVSRQHARRAASALGVEAEPRDLDRPQPALVPGGWRRQ